MANDRMRLVFSSERRGDIRGQLGGAHYSYRFVEAAFRRAFQRRGHDVAEIEMPEIFKDEASCSQLLGATAANIAHIAFRSTENLRVLPGALNIAHFAWEFGVMKNHGLASESITANQVHMLSLMDEVWVQCAFTQAVLQRYGVEKVRVVPAPLIEAELPERVEREAAHAFLGSLPVVPLILSNGLSRDDNVALSAQHVRSLSAAVPLRAGSKLFLTICNPHDLRKNLLNLVEGFQLAAGREDHHLIIKLLVPNKGNFHPYLPYDSFAPRHFGPAVTIDERVHLIADYLPDFQMRYLYGLADFYVSASHCEGLNMPLVEAMAHGMVPVATRNTAMLDYVSEQNAIVIDERQMTALMSGMAGDVSGETYAVGSATRFDIARAMRAAIRLTPERLASLEANARDTVAERYGEKRVMTEAFDRLGALHAMRTH